MPFPRLDPNEKGGAGRLTVSHELAQSMMDFAFYGVGSPPQFHLAAFPVGCPFQDGV
jgi:hypothetical protein